MAYIAYKKNSYFSEQGSSTCPNQCRPGEYYLPAAPPTWKPPEESAPRDVYCAAALMGTVQDPGGCYSGCYDVPMPCYAYGMNIVTPKPWTYPGMRNNSTMPDVNNCSDLIQQTVSDGSTFSATLPTTLPPGTHLMAAYAGGGEYHYARYDTDSKLWSSKNGPNPATQYDNNNNLITDASKAFFTLNGQKLNFCGYFITGPSMVCPKPGQPGGCVDGEPQYTIGSAYPGCGAPAPMPPGPF